MVGGWFTLKTQVGAKLFQWKSHLILISDTHASLLPTLPLCSPHSEGHDLALRLHSGELTQPLQEQWGVGDAELLRKPEPLAQSFQH